MGEINMSVVIQALDGTLRSMVRIYRQVSRLQYRFSLKQ